MKTCWSSLGSSATSSSSPPLTSGWEGTSLWKTRRRARSRPWARDKLRLPKPSSSESVLRFKSDRGVPAGSRGGRGGTCRPERRRQSHGTHPQTPFCHPLPGEGQAAGHPGPGPGAGKGSPAQRRPELRPQRRVGAAAAPSPGRVRPAPPRPSRRSRLPGPRGESSCNFAGEAAPAWTPEPACAPRSGARPGAPTPRAAPARPLCARRGAPRPGPRPGHKRARGRRAGPGGARAAPGRPGRAGRRAHLPWNQSLQASHSIMKRVTS